VKWVEHEFFYCHVDKPYFQYNEFKDILKRAGLENVGKLSRGEWNIIRKAMGKPKRFSAKFINLEKAKLERYRNIARSFLTDTQFNIDAQLKNKFILNEVKKLLPVSVG
jgi:hypothetical protein